jgi:hypothetical protein
MSNLRDTLINIQIFAFVGLLVWLYFRPSHLEKSKRAKGERDTRSAKE